MLRYILLGLLQYQALTGYQIKSLIDDSILHFWHVYHSQIYTTLRKMEEEGLVASELDDEAGDKLQRRVYIVTDAGKAVWEEWLRAPMLESVPVKEELMVRVFFSGERDPEAVLDELRTQRQLHQQKLDYYLALEPRHLVREFTDQLPTDALPEAIHRAIPFWSATLQFGIAYEQMYLQWLEQIIGMLNPS